MPPVGLAARRRAVRSSGLVPVVLLTGLLCLMFILSQRISSGVSGFDEGMFPSSRRSQKIFRKNSGHDSSLAQDTQVTLNDMASSDTTGSWMPLRLISFNIRYDAPNPFPGEHPWSIRGPKLAAQLNFITQAHPNAFIALQEALDSQVTDIHAALGPSWDYIGSGRDDGKRAGEFSPVFYRADVWRCERSETRWLSHTPEKPSKGWDAALNRVVSIGRFVHKKSGTKVVVMSTHFDHRGVKARRKSAELLLKFAEEWATDQDSKDEVSAVLLGGDFNSPPDEDAYKIMVAPGSGMKDLSELVPNRARYGNYITYTSFGEPTEIPSKIDFLFMRDVENRPNEKTRSKMAPKVKTFGVLANSFDDQIRFSDHRAVVADLDIAV